MIRNTFQVWGWGRRLHLSSERYSCLFGGPSFKILKSLINSLSGGCSGKQQSATRSGIAWMESLLRLCKNLYSSPIHFLIPRYCLQEDNIVCNAHNFTESFLSVLSALITCPINISVYNFADYQIPFGLAAYSIKIESKNRNVTSNIPNPS